jgi:hypothetical protein
MGMGWKLKTGFSHFSTEKFGEDYYPFLNLPLSFSRRGGVDFKYHNGI